MSTTTPTVACGYVFTEEEMRSAAARWRANCGPAALAFACRLPIDAVRGVIPDFEQKRYTSPTMMAAGLAALGRAAERLPADAHLFDLRMALVRVQWTGPWTEPGANPKWAYRHTHWVACWYDFLAAADLVFDVNAGIVTYPQWREKTVPLLTGGVPRADGGWRPTHVWRLNPRKDRS